MVEGWGSAIVVVLSGVILSGNLDKGEIVLMGLCYV